MNLNAQKILEAKIIELNAAGVTPKLLLHACCAPCSSYVIEYLASIFDITLFFYNPNITPQNEYTKRFHELERLIAEMPTAITPKIIIAPYNCNEFFDIAKGYENLAEGGERCFRCYRLRLEKTAAYAEENGFDYFTTTLSISPHKNAEKLNQIGLELGKNLKNTQYLCADFKKKNGYKRSIELSKIYNLYRQNYCGCVFSKNIAETTEK